ncbi:hypothetical protein D7B24_007962 [Verticillium nonalfalfae]|uniref:Phospholipase n=1 Tax=Verticillium nonalfalfae TaxID=1051616 RepID=A0A3M9Y5T7_9PEZI|nr:uncharacterized protein D7B24_007962 [Verticillium nonalfalfae]RNJ55869.1 hypothetical protein D7B24_007962 [Verticillium nonalfalfae]
MDSIFRKVERGIDAIFGDERHSHTKIGHECHEHHPTHHASNRYQSFAPQSTGNAKWYVDGCSYFWAVSEALENARESIYILDWWLSPEIYLRRPPAANERYRLDNMLKAAAERGVKVSIIVYREVEAALTLNSAHTRKHLEGLHPNISVFRHPDHVPTGYDIQKELGQSFSNMTLNTATLSKVSGDALKAIYGTATDGVVLFWAHHEKLCLIDRKVAFMGGLDLCFGRWDTNSHPIADSHPGNLDAIVFPGQDYNNARVYDFADVGNWNQNKLDRTKSSRMGWSDVSLSLNGPVVESLTEHFTDRWNFIFDEKYTHKNPGKYERIEFKPRHSHLGFHRRSGEHERGGFLKQDPSQLLGGLSGRFSKGVNKFMHDDSSSDEEKTSKRPHRENEPANIQLTRSCTKWSAGHATEHSIANAYIDAITNARHFVYIENQFFITATCDEQRPVSNKIGRAMVDRILRAHEAGENFKIIVIMPAVPAFAGDLKADDALGTRAIMEFQYKSISQGGYSILETLQKEGVEDVGRYIRFYNLRSYDRINVSSTMKEAEKQSGVSYEDARKERDNALGSGYAPYGEQQSQGQGQYERYQQAAAQLDDSTWDSVSACYMNVGPDLRSVPWKGDPEAEISAFVTEQLYVHTKLLIADDRLVICGSANLNDRSQLGSHDSEIAVVIEDPVTVDSYMDGAPYAASRFAASLRRHIFRKHLGLLPHQRCDSPDPHGNWSPVDRGLNAYDWNSPADALVRDPMSRNFWNLWDGTARTNTDVFSKVFHCVPNDHVRTWKDYDEFFSRHFANPGTGKPGDGKVEYGHVVTEEFPGGVAEVKEWLSRVRGNLVEMPLKFLIDVPDIAIEGLQLNSFTQELYT